MVLACCGGGIWICCPHLRQWILWPALQWGLHDSLARWAEKAEVCADRSVLSPWSVASGQWSVASGQKRAKH